MKILFSNAKIMSSPYESMVDGAVLVDGNRIAYVGSDRADLTADKIIDCGGNLLMSGFCNAHSHAAMSLFRGVADDFTLEQWLQERIFPLERNLSPDDVYWGTMLQVAEFVRSGITCFADMYFYPDSIYAAALNAHMCIALCCGGNSLSGADILTEIVRN